ncbi:hypothetical protein ACFOZ7_09540 [Natribaculum luteum]|uniref:Uncharacterized protein n=1 Tax=Natribaculum luteum TaxID=1586232 RepID=A0ABD5NYU0_9EURY|nr:hypothetical protein [Natribaculum luteum]
MIETIVDKLVIRGDDPREPHASRSGMKLRAVAVAITPAVALLAIAIALEVPSVIATVGPIVLLVVGVKLVACRINERIQELEMSDTRGESEA